jgi:hypothetical protein
MKPPFTTHHQDCVSTGPREAVIAPVFRGVSAITGEDRHGECDALLREDVDSISVMRDVLFLSAVERPVQSHKT